MSEPQPQPERWYLPTWGERLMLMRWRVLYFVPALGAMMLMVAAPFLMLVWWKLWVILVGLPMSAAIRTAKHAVALRKEPFCIHCGYTLVGLAEGHVCPECGMTTSYAEMEDYRRDPHWFIQRRRMGKVLPAAGAMIEAGPVRSKRSRDGT